MDRYLARSRADRRRRHPPAGSLGNSGEGLRDHHYEILYSTPAPTLWAGAALTAPLPALLPQPLHVRRVWRLPSDNQPLVRADAWRRLPGPGAGRNDEGAVSNRPTCFVCSGRRAIVWPDRPVTPSSRQALADAAAQVCCSTRNGKPLPLRDVFSTEITSRVHSTRVRDRLPLVIDARALAEAERDAGYSIPLDPVAADDHGQLPWEKDEIGLVTLTGRSATLLTTRQQLESWSREGAGLPGAVDDAVAEAARSGHDVSGRYRALWDWPDTTLETSIPLAGAWTEWEPATGQAGDKLVVVRTSAVQIAAAGAAVLALFLIWRPRGRSRRMRLAVLALLLGTTGLALWWLPSALQALAWWPFLATATAGLFWHLHLAWGPSSILKTKKILDRERLVSGVIALLTLYVLCGDQGLLARRPADTTPDMRDPPLWLPGSWTVFVVPAESGAGETVYAPAGASRPVALSNRRYHHPQIAVVVAADYDGKVVGSVASMQAVLRAPGTPAPEPFWPRCPSRISPSTAR